MATGPSQHYTFCHRALPSIFFHDPGWFFGVLGGDDRQRFLTDVWAQAGERSAPETRREPEGLRGAAIRRGPYLFALIYLPAPAEAAECHFVCMIAGFASPEAPSVDALAWARVFTLELGDDFTTGEACTFFCEWTRDGKHRNLGEGPEPTATAFVTAVLEAVKNDPEPVAQLS